MSSLAATAVLEWVTLSPADLRALDEKGSGHTSTDPIHVHRAVLGQFDTMVAERRHFHKFPEVSFKEFETAKKIVSILKDDLGLTEIWTEVGVTGVVAMIRGEAGDGPCIMLRADMDALPIQETAEISYKSQNPNVMHACGHDGHMSALLGAARVLNDLKTKLKGSIKLCFQPAEEGKNGAGAMIKDGILEDGPCGPRVDYCYGIHLWSFEPFGVVNCSHGPVMAASDRFEIEVGGKGGHGAAPHASVDAIVKQATLINSLQTVISRSKDPLKSGVLTCGTISGGYAYNIIADKVKISGTCRSFTTDTQEKIKTRMEDICCGVDAMYGGKTTMEYHYGYPPTINAHPECVDNVNRAASKIVGTHRAGLPQKTMGAEDFSYFLQERPGCFFFVGGAREGIIRPHHKSVFDFDERAMLVSAATFVQLIVDQLM